MVFKLPDADQRDAALALDGAELFDPSGRGRPFKEWVQVPAAHEDRWPEFAEAALRRGVRCSVHLVRELPRGALVLSLFGVRPGVLDAESNPVADMLAAFGGAMLTNATAYNQAQRTASQLKDAVVARSVTDQAKGILMHALGCDADEALKRLRQESQRRHVKVTEVATEVVAAYSGEEPKTKASN